MRFKKVVQNILNISLADLQSKPTIYFLFYEFQQYLLKLKKKQCQEINTNKTNFKHTIFIWIKPGIA